MDTRIECIYHCLVCGRIERGDLDMVPPQCCGQIMTKSCSEATFDSSATEAQADEATATAPPAKDLPAKPR